LRMRKIRLAPSTLRTLLRPREMRADFIHQDFCKAITTKCQNDGPGALLTLVLSISKFVLMGPTRNYVQAKNDTITLGIDGIHNNFA
jgi:hypothetical protein